MSLLPWGSCPRLLQRSPSYFPCFPCPNTESDDLLCSLITTHKREGLDGETALMTSGALSLLPPSLPSSLLSMNRRCKIRDASLGYPRQNKQTTLSYSLLCQHEAGPTESKAGGRRVRTQYPPSPSSHPKAGYRSVEGRSQNGQGRMEGQEGGF